MPRLTKNIIGLMLVTLAAFVLPTTASQASVLSCVDYPVNSTGPSSCSGGFSTTTAFWYYGGGYGLEHQELYTWGNGINAGPNSTATWRIGGLNQGQVYEVEAYIPSQHAYGNNVHYAMYNGAGVYQGDGFIDQANFNNVWVEVGVACSDGTVSVTMDDSHQATNLQLGADALKVVKLSSGC